jgi:hypothetical protein
MPVSMDLTGVSSSGRLRRRTPVDASCLEVVGSDGIRSGAPVFLSDPVWFQRERCEAVMDVELWGLAMVSLCGNEELASGFMTHSSSMDSGGDSTGVLIGRQRRLCTVSFLEASLLEMLDFWCCLGGVSAAATRNLSL